MTEQDLVIQDLKAENAKLKEQLKEQSKPTEQVDKDELTEEMLGYICDALCKNPCNIKDVEKLERVCAECQVENYLANIKLATIKVLESKKKGFKDCISKQEVQLNREWNKAIEACIETVKAGGVNES